MHARKMKWAGCNALDDSVQFFAELSPQTEALRLIPLARFQRLVFGLSGLRGIFLRNFSG